MTTIQTTAASPLQVAKNRWDEATRVTTAYQVQLAVRKRRAYEAHGRGAQEVQAWADVAEAEAQLRKCEADEVIAWEDVAWLEKQAQDQRRKALARTRRTLWS